MSRVSFTVKVNTLGPALKKLSAAGKDTTPVMRSMGNVFKSITEGNFNSVGSSRRPAPWPAKKDGTPATLKKSGLLWHSFHLTLTPKTATLANPTPYAAHHQFGSSKTSGRGSGLPARPFYPVANGELTRYAQAQIAAAGERAIKRALGI